MTARGRALLLCIVSLASCGGPTAGLPGEVCLDARAPAGTRVLVFSRTAGFRHESIAAGVAAIRTLGERHAFAVAHTEEPTAFSPDSISRFSAVVFLNTTGNVLDATQEAVFENYIRAGGGFAGVHSAADTEYEWPWYGQLMGAYFQSHPAIQQATVNTVDANHLSTRCLPQQWVRRDEWYNYRAPPAAGVTILATLDEGTYTGGTMGATHPVVWHHRFDGGRAWYTAMGHTTESYADSVFLKHLAGGILWAAGVAE
jgi:type 1 glutamine amidotransferase